MNDKILALLRSSAAHVSGEDISRQLGISRSAIWKHMQELRQQGYDIVAVPHLGYQLASSPDLLVPQEISFDLNTKVVGKKIFHYDTVDSTMDIAMRLGMDGSPEGTVVFAESQQKGRGRLGRTWSSPKNKGIYFSLILKPNILPLESPKLTLLIAIAICEAIRKMTKLDCLIKWPNDLLINNNKICGILTEMNAEADRIKCVVVGVGINVNTSSSALLPKATSLKEELGERVSRTELAKELLRSIDKEYATFLKEGFHPFIKRWLKLSATSGHRVRVHSHNEYIEGEALDIDEDGGLLIRRDSGFIEKITAGDVVKIR